MLSNIVKVSITKDKTISANSVACAAYVPHNVSAGIVKFKVVASWQDAYDYFQTTDASAAIDPQVARPFLDFIAGYYADNVDKPLLVPDASFSDVSDELPGSASVFECSQALFTNVGNYRVDFVVLSPHYINQASPAYSDMQDAAALLHDKRALLVIPLRDEELGE